MGVGVGGGGGVTQEVPPSSDILLTADDSIEEGESIFCFFLY